MGERPCFPPSSLPLSEAWLRPTLFVIPITGTYTFHYGCGPCPGAPLHSYHPLLYFIVRRTAFTMCLHHPRRYAGTLSLLIINFLDLTSALEETNGQAIGDINSTPPASLCLDIPFSCFIFFCACLSFSYFGAGLGWELGLRVNASRGGCSLDYGVPVYICVAECPPSEALGSAYA